MYLFSLISFKKKSYFQISDFSLMVSVDLFESSTVYRLCVYFSFSL